MRIFFKTGLLLVVFALASCFNPPKTSVAGGRDAAVPDSAAESAAVAAADRFALVMRNAELPPALSQKIQAEAAAADSAFMRDLFACLAQDRHLRELVDKQHSLPPEYVPDDLVTLAEGEAYRLNRQGMLLRQDAAQALAEMAAAARAEGVTLIASSAYRSYDYQETVYNRIVREMGQEAADRESARPGNSQHQTGLALDFGSIDDSFAQTKAGRWLAERAPEFGWSLSFPDGYEAVTGYRWESWHYRYVGRELSAFINNYFDGIQQYALRFIHEWNAYQAQPGIS